MFSRGNCCLIGRECAYIVQEICSSCQQRFGDRWAPRVNREQRWVYLLLVNRLNTGKTFGEVFNKWKGPLGFFPFSDRRPIGSSAFASYVDNIRSSRYLSSRPSDCFVDV